MLSTTGSPSQRHSHKNIFCCFYQIALEGPLRIKGWAACDSSRKPILEGHTRKQPRITQSNRCTEEEPQLIGGWVIMAQQV